MKRLKILYFIISMFLSWNMSAEILTVTNINDSGTGSLRRMVEIANFDDSIIFDKSLAGKTINLQSDILETESTSITISGKNASVTISGAGINCATIDNLTFNNSNGTNCSIVSNCDFKNCTNGAITSDGEITNCTFENNSNPSGGGAIYSDHGVTITNCTFKNNYSGANGGAICYPDGSMEGGITNCIFENNTSVGYGGAIYVNSSNDYLFYAHCSNCTFSNNSAKDGGAIYDCYSATNCTFWNNTATEYGGAIAFCYSATNCTFSNNTANNGGAIRGGSNLTGNLFINNKIMPDNILNDVYIGSESSGYSGGYNVYTSNQNTIFSESTDYRYTGTQSLLVPLGNYGGDTPSMPINTSVPNWESIVRRVPVSYYSQNNIWIQKRNEDQRGFLLPTTGLVCAGSVEMQPNEHYTSIYEIKKESVYVYPNPTSDIIHFILNGNSGVQLYDTSGKLVKEQSGKIGSNEINIKDLPIGVYFLNVDGQTTKIMKK